MINTIMCSLPKYTSEILTSMNYGTLWNNCITVPKDIKNNSDVWELHATGDCDLNGRKYVALPPGTNTKDSEIKAKYNLM